MAKGGATVLNLGESLTIASVAELHRNMVAGLESGGGMVLQGGEIKQIDGAGLQLLAALIREAAETDVAIRWDGLSDTLQQGIRRLGLNEILVKEAAPNV